jgi:ribosomal protein S6--L-glutamate ligase
MSPKNLQSKIFIGWQEWCALPSLKIPAIKAKIDTGAKTSAIHAVNIERHRRKQKDYVRFDVYPIQGESKPSCRCDAELVDIRAVMSSNGIKEKRPVIKTDLVLGDQRWTIEMTLSNREPLKFRMLLGREALGTHVLIDPHQVCHLGRMKRTEVEQLYL